MERQHETDVSPTLVAGFLANQHEAVRTIAGWARQVATHRAWGFETPEDIVQTTLLALVTCFRERRFAGGNLKAYVQRISKNACISSYRHARVRRGTVSIEAEPVSETVAAPPAEVPEERLTAERILERMEEPCRQIIDLAYRLGLSRKEIADRLEITEAAARVRLFRCLQAARALAEQ